MYLEAVKLSRVRVSGTPGSTSAAEQLGTLRLSPSRADPGSGHLTTEAEREAGRCLVGEGVASAVEVHIKMP